MPEVIPRDYAFRTEPFAHQEAEFYRSRDRELHALLWQQRTGKTKVAIDAAAWAFMQDEIDALVILAPNGVHSNWTRREVPAHLPEYVPRRCLTWRAQAADRRWFRNEMDRVLSDRDALAVFAMNLDGVITQKGKKALWRFLSTRRCMMVVDESSRIKTPGAKRTRTLWAAGKYAVRRWILTGTPVTQGPLDLYAQFRFLDPEILGFQTFTAFKHHFADWVKRENSWTGTTYEELQGYKNLDELRGLIAPHSSRLLRQDCRELMDNLSPVTRYFELSEKQREVYERLRSDLVLELSRPCGECGGSGEVDGPASEGKVACPACDGTGRANQPVPLALTRLLRLQQITSNFYKDEDDREHQVGKANPRLNALLACLEEDGKPAQGKAIVWCRFRRDIVEVAGRLRAWMGDDAVVEYHGGVGQEDREDAVDRFQNDEACRVFVGQPRAGGMGLTLSAADLMVFYSNDFSLETRMQAEDRGVGGDAPVAIVDLAAGGTVDEHIAESLQAKRDLAEDLTGDKLKQLLENER